MEEVD